MNADGSPTLLSGTAPATPAALTADGPSVSSQAQKIQWGIYIDGQRFVEIDSILALDYSHEWTIADYPIEGGVFESYDKVARPFDVRLRVSKGGTLEERRTFLSDIELIAASFELVDVISPEASYVQVSVTKLGLGRTAEKGATLLSLDIGLRQVRVSATATFANVQSPDAAAPVNGGTVQPAPVPAATAAEIAAGVTAARAGFDDSSNQAPAF